MRDKHKVFLRDPYRMWENDCYCIDYANETKLDCATSWKKCFHDKFHIVCLVLTSYALQVDKNNYRIS